MTLKLEAMEDMLRSVEKSVERASTTESVRRAILDAIRTVRRGLATRVAPLYREERIEEVGLLVKTELRILKITKKITWWTYARAKLVVTKWAILMTM